MSYINDMFRHYRCLVSTATQTLLETLLPSQYNDMFTNSQCDNGNELITDLARPTSANENARNTLKVKGKGEYICIAPYCRTPTSKALRYGNALSSDHTVLPAHPRVYPQTE